MSFTPTRYQISDITQANPAVVTITTNPVLTTGQVVRILIPKAYGMQELNNKLVSISVLTSSTYSLQYTQIPFVNVDSTKFSPFVNVGTGTPPQMIAVGSGPTPSESPGVFSVPSNYDSLLGDAQTNTSTSEIPF